MNFSVRAEEERPSPARSVDAAILNLQPEVTIA